MLARILNGTAPIATSVRIRTVYGEAMSLPGSTPCDLLSAIPGIVNGRATLRSIGIGECVRVLGIEAKREA